jgi:hypothetical protein
MEKTRLRSINSLKGYQLGAHDGGIGACSDFLFDDESWIVRYLLADTRKWLPGRKVLVSPISIGKVDVIGRTVDVDLSKEQIKNSPPLEMAAPVSRKYEMFFNKHFGWSDYWDGSGLWGDDTYPGSLKLTKEMREIEQSADRRSNIRSTNEVAGYRIHAQDDDIGHIEDFLVEEETWIIRYLVIDTSNWIPGSKRVIVDPNWVDQVRWDDRSVYLRMTKEQIENSPEYDPLVPIYRDYEQSIFDHYDFPYYW